MPNNAVTGMRICLEMCFKNRCDLLIPMHIHHLQAQRQVMGAHYELQEGAESVSVYNYSYVLDYQ